LIRTKNKGVNEAMEIIFQIQEEMENEKEDTDERKIRPEWYCS
jgi:hypothetical protein